MNKERLKPLLLGRWLAIKNGLEPGPAADIDQLFYRGKFSYHRGQNSHIKPRHRSHSAQKKIRYLVRSLDKLAKEVYDGSTTN